MTFHPKLWKIANKRLSGVNFIEHDIYESLDGIYDIIFCTEVLEHIIISGKNALNNLISAVNRAVTIFLTVPDGRIDNFEGHINFWSPKAGMYLFKTYNAK